VTTQHSDDPRDTRAAGVFLAQLLSRAAARLAPGLTTLEIANSICDDVTEISAEPIMLGAIKPGSARPFPVCAAINVNEEVTHAIPSPRILRAGDIVTIDIALRSPRHSMNCVDAAVTRVVAPTDSNSRGAMLMRAARCTLAAALRTVGADVPWDAVVQAASLAAASHGACLIQELSSHGIGRALHQPPSLPWRMGTGVTLRAGMTLAIEPVVAEGAAPPFLVELDDGWTTITADRRWAAFEERSVSITPFGVVPITPLFRAPQTRHP
jgi:methionyl aminopeptidase